ncbi:MAG: hypothetical protein U0Q55_14010 [Vicinamibacterales bacterium]
MFVAAGLLLAAVALVATPQTERPRVHLDVVMERGVVLAFDDLRQALAHAVAIWRPVVDVSIALPDAPRPAGSADALRVVISNRRLEGVDTGLAWIPFVDGEPQRELTVSMPGVRRLLEQGSWNGRPFTSLPKQASSLFLQRAIGRAVAHEIGHYLLRTRSHEGSGLMRAVFTVDEIMKARPALGPAARSYARRMEAAGGIAAARTR